MGNDKIYKKIQKIWHLPDPSIQAEGEEVWRRGGSKHIRKCTLFGRCAVGGPSGVHPGSTTQPYPPRSARENVVFQAGDRSTGGALTILNLLPKSYRQVFAIFIDKCPHLCTML